MEPSLLFFLTIDRCFLLNYPVNYSKSKQKTVLIASIIFGILLGVSNEIVFILDLPDTSETSKNFGAGVPGGGGTSQHDLHFWDEVAKQYHVDG